jgi:hypothetical protein
MNFESDQPRRITYKAPLRRFRADASAVLQVEKDEIVEDAYTSTSIIPKCPAISVQRQVLLIKYFDVHLKKKQRVVVAV